MGGERNSCHEIESLIGWLPPARPRNPSGCPDQEQNTTSWFRVDTEPRGLLFILVFSSFYFFAFILFF